MVRLRVRFRHRFRFRVRVSCSQPMPLVIGGYWLAIGPVIITRIKVYSDCEPLLT